MGKCIGCGIELQSIDKDLPGYIPLSSQIENKEYCMRCYQIRHHNLDYSHNNLAILKDPTKLATIHHQYFNMLKNIENDNCLVLLIIDALDLYNGFIPKIAKMIGTNPLWILVNKCDLLPKDLKLDFIKDIIYQEGLKNDLKINNLYFISSKNLKNIDNLLRRIKDTINKKGFNKKYLYVIGSTSVGKSTFINQIIDHYGGVKDIKNVLTTSLIANTTNNNVAIFIGTNYQKEDCYIIDTPGYLNPHTILSYLSYNALKVIIPNNYLKVRTYQISSNQTYLIDNIAYLDVFSNKCSLSFYVSNNLFIQRSKLENKNKGLNNFQNHPDCLNWQEDELAIINDKKDIEIIVDKPLKIWLSGLGFISVNPTMNTKIIVTVPKIMKVSVSYD